MEKATYSPTTEDGKCVFCEINKSNIKPRIFWEDENYIAFLSGWPNTEGFSVILPKEHYDSDVLKMPNDKLQEFILVAKKVSNILMKYFKDVGRVGLITEGTGVNHAHIKLFPMHGTENLKEGNWEQVHSKIDTYFEKYEGHISSNEGPKADEQKLIELAKKLKEIQ